MTSYRPSPGVTKAAVLVVLLVAVGLAVYAVSQPSLAVSVYALIPVLLSAFWFGMRGALPTATAAVLLFLGNEIVAPSPELAGSRIWLATLNRAAVFYGVAVLVTVLLRRERALTLRLQAQQSELEELTSLRAVLTPAEIPVPPHLDLASSFTPADGLVAGDFFLVTPGPAGSTTVVVGDVVGHGLEAARCAAFVRASLSTFAPFSRDPVQLLQLANTALTEHGDGTARFVTAVCVNIGALPELEVCWASAGHDVPWYLDTAEDLPGERIGAPLGVGSGSLQLAPHRVRLDCGDGVLLFTDGLLEARPAARDQGRPLELFGEERARGIVRSLRGAAPRQVLDALADAAAAFAEGPLADDVCLVAFRTRAA